MMLPVSPIKHLICEHVDKHDIKQQQTHSWGLYRLSNPLEADVDIGIVGGYMSLVLDGSLVLTIEGLTNLQPFCMLMSKPTRLKSYNIIT